MPEHCVDSVIEIRHYLTGEITGLGADDDIVGDLRAMRAACRRFVTDMGELEDRAGRLLPRGSGTPSWMFTDALGQLRAVIGQHVAIIATKFGIDIEDDLASILPAADTNDDDDGDDGPRRRWRR